ncbi:MAG: GNAT family N-acetyltransferase [Thermoplasmata archaeon]|nr:GNAT family N-acetyltransferase [Thermoplasmata archaeon]
MCEDPHPQPEDMAVPGSRRTPPMMEYRPLEASEEANAVSLISDVYREVLGREINKFVRDEVRRILEEFDDSQDLFLIAEHDGELVGTLIMEHANPEPGCCNMQFLAVRPDHRGHGHGHELLTKGIDFARTAGYKTVELNATADFDFALAMYERMGFEHIDTYLWQENEVYTFDKFL